MKRDRVRFRHQCSTYFIEDLRFDDDPLMKGIDGNHRDQLLTGVGGSGVVTPRKDPTTGRTTVTRDIRLGEKFASYPECGPNDDALRD